MDPRTYIIGKEAFKGLLGETVPVNVGCILSYESLLGKFRPLYLHMLSQT
jgi:hypothetical protein